MTLCNHLYDSTEFLEMLPLFLLFLTCIEAFRFNIDVNERLSFSYDFYPGLMISVQYEVISGGFLDVNFYMIAPSGLEISQRQQDNAHRYLTKTSENGTYTFVFDNSGDVSAQQKEVAFVVNVADPADQPVNQTKIGQMVKDLKSSVENIQQEAQFLHYRQFHHNILTVSTNAMVLCWSIFEVVSILGLAVIQLHYFRRFFEVRSII